MAFLYGLLLLCSVSSTSWGSDITALPLLEPIPYQRDSHFYQYAMSKAGVSTIGRMYNVDDEIKKQIAPFKKDLAKYFPKPNEFNKLVDDVLLDINQNIVRGKLTDDKVTAVYSYVGKNLIAKIADRILDTEGVKDEKRRVMWVNKILEPFNSCISRSLDSQFSAKHCMGALTAGLVPNIGNGLVYELSKSSLSSSLPEEQQTSFNQTQVEAYQLCLKDFLPAATPENVKNCTLVAMRKGIKLVTDTKLSDKLKKIASSATVADQIKREVWPSFDGCVQKVGSSKTNQVPLAKQFFSCIDKLIQDTGERVVADKIINHKSLQLSFPGPELKKLSAEKALQFKKCSHDLVAKNIRKDGLIDTDTCENAVTNDLVYMTALKKFNQSAAEQVKGTKIDASLLEKDAKKILDSCWRQNQKPEQKESCLRKSIIDFSKIVAEKRLAFAIPATLPTKGKISSEAIVTLQSCLEKNLPISISEEEHLSDKMDPCTTGLLRATTDTVVTESIDFALSENLADKKENLSSQRAALRSQLLARFHECFAKSKDLTPCTDQTTKDATLSIALAAGRANRTQHLPKSPTPSEKYLAIENDLKTCTATNKTGEELSDQLDMCKKNFSIEVARELGVEKFNNTLKDLLGEKRFEASLPHTSIVLKKFKACLDRLYKDYKSVTTCTDQLSSDGELVFKESMSEWMSSEEKDAATLAIKAQFVDFLPCLGGLLPSGGNSETAKIEKDVAPMMEIVAKAIAQYIEYSPENAKQDLDELIKQFAKDMRETADTAMARKNIIDLLYKNGAFDQFLKSYVRKIVGDSFASMSDGEMPKQLKDALISKENFDAVFQGSEGKKIKDALLNQLITPLIAHGKSSSSPEVVASIADITNQVTHLLINSPHFGEKIIANQVQGSLDNIGALKGIFVKLFYGGKNALDWQRVRQTPEGQMAENYIKENIMTPKFKKTTLSPAELKKRNTEAERLVSAAVKSYREPKK